MWKAIWEFISIYFEESAKFSVSLVRDDLQSAMSWIYSSNANHQYFVDLYSIFASPAIALLLVYFSMDLFDKLSSENFTIDTLILDFAKIVAGVALINNGIYIMQGLYGISEWICDIISSTVGSQSVEFSTSATANDLNSIWDIIVLVLDSITAAGSVISFLEMIIISLIEQICISIVAYQRAVRLGMRIIISPLVMADVVGHGLNNNSMHYLKTIFALCMEGPIICLAVAFVPIAMYGVSSTMLFAGVALAFVIVKLMFGAHKTAKDMFV